MSWHPLWRKLFKGEPSENAAQALDELARLGGADDPMVVIAMFLHRQHDLFEQHGSTFRTQAGELERAAVVLREHSQSIADASATVTKATSFVTSNVIKAVAAVGGLEQRVSLLIQNADECADELDDARESLRKEQLWWRLDLKLVRALAGALTIVALLAMMFIHFRSPPMTIPTAAAFLVGPEAAPALVELQRQGDLQAILECRGKGWQKVVGYCQPGARPNAIRGWNTAPRPELPDRPAPFTAK